MKRRRYGQLTTPCPASFPKTEIGLMTSQEFLRLRNPHGKSHSSESYNFDLSQLNRDHPQHLGKAGYGEDEVTAERLSGGCRLRNRDGDVVAIIHKGTAYYDRPHWKRRIPGSVRNQAGNGVVQLGVASFKQVKYLSELVTLISPVAEINAARYPFVLQRIIVQGEPMSVRADNQPKKDAGTTLAIFNADGLVVAQASNEWGATLLTVAQEYRGKGLGKIIGQYWYEMNPSFESGGFTPAGQQNALAQWRERVAEFSARGWYSALVRQGRLTHERVNEILAGAGRQERPVAAAPQTTKSTGDVLVYSDGVTFVVYDRAFLVEPDDRFIHGFGFFRDDPSVGAFLFRIEYDRPFADMVTRVALQIAKDNGEDLYDGEGYHDMLETEGIPGVVRRGDHIKVTRDLVAVKALSRKEKAIREAADPYREKHALLLEMAESKWS